MMNVRYDDAHPKTSALFAQENPNAIIMEAELNEIGHIHLEISNGSEEAEPVTKECESIEEFLAIMDKLQAAEMKLSDVHPEYLQIVREDITDQIEQILASE